MWLHNYASKVPPTILQHGFLLAAFGGTAEKQLRNSCALPVYFIEYKSIEMKRTSQLQDGHVNARMCLERLVSKGHQLLPGNNGLPGAQRSGH